MPGALAFRYARALADAAPKDAPKTLADLAAFEAAVAASPHLKVALDSPAVARERKRTIVKRVAETAGLSDAVRRFLSVLADHRRIPLVDEIREAFQAVMDERAGVVRVEVHSARELTPEQKQEIVAGFGRITGKRAEASFALDPELIGGALAKVGSTVYDGSVRGQLQGLERRMAGSGE